MKRIILLPIVLCSIHAIHAMAPDVDPGINNYLNAAKEGDISGMLDAARQMGNTRRHQSNAAGITFTQPTTSSTTTRHRRTTHTSQSSQPTATSYANFSNTQSPIASREEAGTEYAAFSQHADPYISQFQPSSNLNANVARSFNQAEELINEGRKNLQNSIEESNNLRNHILDNALHPAPSIPFMPTTVNITRTKRKSPLRYLLIIPAVAVIIVPSVIAYLVGKEHGKQEALKPQH